MRDLLQYYGAAASTIAALMVALNLGRVWNGAAMIVFITSSIALIAWGFLQPDSKGIGWQNVALLLINLVGAYRYLIHDAHKRRKSRGAKPGGLNAPPNKAPEARA
jgi:hypothetical protein